jgi:hypothetical protein
VNLFEKVSFFGANGKSWDEFEQRKEEKRVNSENLFYCLGKTNFRKAAGTTPTISDIQLDIFRVLNEVLLLLVHKQEVKYFS